MVDHGGLGPVDPAVHAQLVPERNAALELDLFTELADGPRTCAELSARGGMAPNRLQTLLQDCFHVHHTTLQVDHEAAAQPPLQIEVGRS